jgi:hypothetical protein
VKENGRGHAYCGKAKENVTACGGRVRATDLEGGIYNLTL